MFFFRLLKQQNEFHRNTMVEINRKKRFLVGRNLSGSYEHKTKVHLQQIRSNANSINLENDTYPDLQMSHSMLSRSSENYFGSHIAIEDLIRCTEATKARRNSSTTKEPLSRERKRVVRFSPRSSISVFDVDEPYGCNNIKNVRSSFSLASERVFPVVEP